MAQFNYKAIDKNGKNKKGTIDAADREKAQEKLRAEGLQITELNDAGDARPVTVGKKKVKSRDLSILCKQMVSILNAGVTVITALEMLSEQMDNKTLKKAVVEAKIYVEKGGSLADAMRLNPDVFPPIMINMVSAGELSGSLETSFERLSMHFADMGTELPLPTRMMMAGSDFIINYWFILIPALIGIGVGIKVFLATPTGQLTSAKISINAPIFSDMVIKSNSARFARTLSTLMAAGIPMLDAIEQVAFLNPDGSIVVVIQNRSTVDKNVSLRMADKLIDVKLPAESISSIVVE